MPITPTEYADRAAAYRTEKDGYPVIDVEENPREWRLWLEFFREHGHTWTVSEMERMGEIGQGRWTVPTLDPHDFELSFNRPEAD